MSKQPMFLVGLAILAMAISLQADVIQVPGDYATIQAGINAASPGDTVLVAPGTYNENIQLAENVSLFGSGADNTIIDGGGLNDVIKALNINNFIIQDFTVQNSRQDGSSPGNVGVFINPTSSAGLKIISRCRVRHNGHGIDIWNDFGGVTYIDHNVITDNLYNGFSPYLGLVYLTNNTITANGQDGYYDWSGGGAVYISNNIITENGRYGIFKHHDTPVYISYNDVWNNAQGSYYEGSSGPYVPFDPNPGTGEISADPLFIAPEAGDFHLLAGSPCIDAGDPSSPPDPDSTATDMGAFYRDQNVGIADGKQIPRSDLYIDNYPNPFNASTTIEYALPAPSSIRLDIFDPLGRLVESLDPGYQTAGNYRIAWQASGRVSGFYFYRLRTEEFAITKKMILLK